MLTLADFQRVAADLKLYAAGIDGLWGPSTRAALDALTEQHKHVRKWDRDRIITAGIQLALQRLGYPSGEIDGYYGGLTAAAFAAWQYKKTYGKKEKLDVVVTRPHPTQYPTNNQVNRFYGTPGPQVKSQLVTVDFPYRVVLDWNTDQVVTRMRIHKKCAKDCEAALRAIGRHYGQAEIDRLGLNRFAGSYNHRKMRGGSKWSRHAYGAAVDWFAQPNGLRTRCPDALFCGEEYKAFLDIWEAHGATSLGRVIGRDFMHQEWVSWP